jgi:hypothetical protein
MSDSPFSKVREQYELLPYPPANPEDERRRLVRTWLDDLPMINHYCFGGRQSFAGGFRALVAGGGTGDGTLFLAEQLRHTDARIVHHPSQGGSHQVGLIAKRSLRQSRHIWWEGNWRFCFWFEP